MIDTIKIGNVEVTMKVTGNTPRKYRELFNKDLLIDMQHLMLNVNKDGSLKEGFDWGVIERLAYTMAKQYDETIGSIDDWLDNFGVVDLYGASRHILNLWNKSKESIAEPKKKNEQ